MTPTARSCIASTAKWQISRSEYSAEPMVFVGVTWKRSSHMRRLTSSTLPEALIHRCRWRFRRLFSLTDRLFFSRSHTGAHRALSKNYTGGNNLFRYPFRHEMVFQTNSELTPSKVYD